jgi:hypothetical protein
LVAVELLSAQHRSKLAMLARIGLDDMRSL